MPAETLRLSDVTVRFGGLTAVEHVSLDVAPGEIVGIIGPNGAGKSTLLNAVSGFVESTGEVWLHGKRIDSWLPYRRARHGLARSFQDAALFPTLTVRETLLSACHDAFTAGPLRESLRLPWARSEEREAERRVQEALEVVDLTSYLDYQIAQLSLGTARAVEMACLAIRRPSVLLLDEPASGLQQSEVRALGPMIDRVRRGAAVVVIDHDVPFVSSLSHRLVAMDLGRVVAAGSPDDVLHHPDVLESYLGRAS